MYNKDLEDTMGECKENTKEKCDCHEDCVHEFLQYCECCDCVRCVDCGKIWEERVWSKTQWYYPRITYGIGRWSDMEYLQSPSITTCSSTTNRGCAC
jgi:hypothetical protein